MAGGLTMTRDEFSAAVCAMQTRLTLDDKAMAALLGVPIQTWYHWRRGTREPAAATVRLLEVRQTAEGPVLRVGGADRCWTTIS